MCNPSDNVIKYSRIRKYLILNRHISRILKVKLISLKPKKCEIFLGNWSLGYSHISFYKILNIPRSSFLEIANLSGSRMHLQFVLILIKSFEDWKQQLCTLLKMQETSLKIELYHSDCVRVLLPKNEILSQNSR